MHLLLDTDIGTDVDDALALGVLLGSPEVDLIGITTVYGDTLLRARLASRLIRLARRGAVDIPIVAGETNTRSGRPVWWPGHEGQHFRDLDTETNVRSSGGVQFITEAARTYAGELEILAIGPLTNIAAALDNDPEFAANVRRIVIMGGDFRTNRAPEHNFLCDVDATRRVFRSALRIEVGGIDLTTQIRLTNADVDQLAADTDFGAALRREIDTFWKFEDKTWNNPHDPILALRLILPELFITEHAAVEIRDDGISMDMLATDAAAEVIRTMEREEVVSQMLGRIRRAGAGVTVR